MAGRLTPCQQENLRLQRRMEDLERELLDREDLHNDIVAGLRTWHGAAEEWTSHDEALLRWLKGGQYDIDL